ncbi:YlaI family protein [Oceanobacillus longus]|uniref:YlaI family protein n=1 Tax=Oceanobacillus longus TaxID=930120 RepID=A0ABV8H3F1_9BACI
MQVKCTLCDKIEDIEDYSLKAKRLRNRRIYMYLCTPCYERVEHKTKKRLDTGKFRLYRENKKVDQYL